MLGSDLRVMDGTAPAEPKGLGLAGGGWASIAMQSWNWLDVKLCREVPQEERSGIAVEGAEPAVGEEVPATLFSLCSVCNRSSSARMSQLKA
mmetsp:Transcript_33352/g.78001  ORF Transcript_33352/g.78001 Transcript_33352/m.78001 type:complete len:92 (+) Transcript_33352:127-402(+)